MEVKEKQTEIFSFTNATLQITAIFSYQYLELLWPMYIVMAMVCLLGAAQTLSASYVMAVDMSKEKLPYSKDSKVSNNMQILVGITYGVSAYHMSLMGFEIFAGFAFAHAAIYTLMIVFKRI